MNLDTSNKNKRIAKNTLALYVRMLFILFVRLFTSRVILQTLGVEDYGIHNAVAGIVVMFSFLNSAMTNATQRFLSYDLGLNDPRLLKDTFNTAVIVHMIIALLIVLLAESIGVWFFYNKMIIPAERVGAAMWAFQCSIIGMAVVVLSVPYNAAIIAHEKMGAFAYISVLEVLLSLANACVLYFVSFDKLKVYAVMTLLISLIIRSVYSSYSKRHFAETSFKFIWDKHKIREMGFFASWSLIGNIALIGVTQGLNLLLNIFFGPSVNAARGISVQVQGAIHQFATNIQVAINPQITKSFASNDLKFMHSLICRSARFSYMMVLLLSLPFFIMADQILQLWLVQPPAYSALFLRIILLTVMVDSLSNPLNNAISSSGIIRNFQLCNGVLMLLVVPLAYVMLKNGLGPEFVFISQLFMTMITHFVKLVFAKRLTNLPIKLFVKEVYVPLLAVTFFSPIVPYLFYKSVNSSFVCFFAACFLSCLSVVFFSYCLGMKKNEKHFINSKIRFVLNK